MFPVPVCVPQLPARSVVALAVLMEIAIVGNCPLVNGKVGDCPFYFDTRRKPCESWGASEKSADREADAPSLLRKEVKDHREALGHVDLHFAANRKMFPHGGCSYGQRAHVPKEGTCDMRDERISRRSHDYRPAFR